MRKVFCAPVKKVMQGDVGPASHQLPRQSPGFVTTTHNPTITEEALELPNLPHVAVAGHEKPIPDPTEPHKLVPARDKKSDYKTNLQPPKKPASNFMIFVDEYRASFTKKGLSHREATDKAVELWNASSPAVKNKYQSKYEKQKAKYESSKAKYEEDMKKKNDQKKGGKGNI